MGNHAILSASSSHRWLNCLPSARLELEFEDQSGEAAKEGTAAHDLCEHKLKKALHMRSQRPISEYNSDEMEECTDAYVDFVMEQVELARKSCTDPIVLIEQRLDFSCYVPDGFGTGDCVIISDDRLHIVARTLKEKRPMVSIRSPYFSKASYIRAFPIKVHTMIFLPFSRSIRMAHLRLAFPAW